MKVLITGGAGFIGSHLQEADPASPVFVNHPSDHLPRYALRER